MSERAIRVGTWNVGRLVSTGVGAEDSDPDRSARRIGDALRRSAADLVALQEVESPTLGIGEATGEAERIADLAGLGHTLLWGVSPSHRTAGQALGLTILSRYPLTQAQGIVLPNPMLSSPQPSGEVWRSHDKGLLLATASTPLGDVTFACLHGLPFHRFGRARDEPAFLPIWRTLSSHLQRLARVRPTIVCGDFNAQSLDTLLPDIVANGIFHWIMFDRTRPNGARSDHVLATYGWRVIRASSEPGPFDHYLCMATLTLGPEAP